MAHGQFLHLFPTPEFLRMPTAGLDIADRSVRFIELRRDRGVYKLAKYDQREVPDEVITNGTIHDPAQLISILSEIREANDLEFVRVALPEEKAYLYHTTVPYVADKNEFREAVEYTIEGNVPLQYAEVVFDYRVAVDEVPDEGEHIDVVVSVLPRKVVDTYLEVLKESGLRALSLMVESQAITQAVVPHEDPGAIMVLNVGDDKTAVYLVDHNMVHFTSTFSTKDGSVSAPAQKNSGTYVFSGPDNKSSGAEDAGPDVPKKHKGAQTANEATMIIPSIVQEVKRVRNYWESHGVASGTEASLRKVIICGNHAYNTRFTQKLAGQLDLPVETADVWTNAFSLEEYVPPVRANQSIFYAAAIGLALSDN